MGFAHLLFNSSEIRSVSQCKAVMDALHLLVVSGLSSAAEERAWATTGESQTDESKSQRGQGWTGQMRRLGSVSQPRAERL